MYIVHVPCFVFIILWYHRCEQDHLHICIVSFEVSRAIFSTYFLYYVVMML